VSCDAAFQNRYQHGRRHLGRAYTAGVLDFLTEALDEWYAAKKSGDDVPMHDVMIEVFSGASAGGMCAAISSVMLYQQFEHIHNVNQQNTNNIFYESWVNKIDIVPLLQTDDLSRGAEVISLLNSKIIDQIAAYALRPPNAAPVLRPYVSPTLTLFLSLTNLRGVPYSLNGAAPGSIEETTFFYGDRIRFQTISGGSTTLPTGSTRTLDLSQPGAAGGWDVLQTAAMATGAFPVFLAPRILNRKLAEYDPPGWESVVSAVTGTPPPIPPNIPPADANPFVTLNVDGGVTNNDPFNYAHDYLLSLVPAITGTGNPHDPLTVDRAVVGIAPFPTTDTFDPKFNAKSAAAITSALPKLFDALIAQARFFGESLSAIMNGVTFGRFVIAPSDDKLVEQYRKSANANPADQPTALQCATLGAFGGFFCRAFRAHDYALGRRNCQKFLRDYFVLPTDNVIVTASLDLLDTAKRAAVIEKFRRPAPGKYWESGTEIVQGGGTLPAVQRNVDREWLPIIPLCGSAVEEVPHPVREKISGSDVDRIVGLVSKRLCTLGNTIVSGVEDLALRLFLLPGPFFISWLAKPKIKRAIISGLGDSYQD
jgi:predicted acylesterase/phospholipase RssA